MSPHPPGHQIRRSAVVFGTAYFVLGLVDPSGGILQLPLQVVLKDQLHLDAEGMAVFFSLALFPWYLKPLAGILSDSVPVGGKRRRPYMLAGTFLALLAFVSLGLVPQQYQTLLWAVVAGQTALMLMSTSTGGLLVEEGQRLGAVGRLTSFRSLAESMAGLVAGPLGGFLAGVAVLVASGICAALVGVLFVVFLCLAQETAATSDPRTVSDRVKAVGMFVRSRDLWIAVGLVCCFQIAPGYWTSLFYHQTDNLHFTPQFIGNLGLCAAAGSVLGASAYSHCVRRIRYSHIFVFSIILAVLMTLAYVGYTSATAAVFISFGNGVSATFAFITLLHLVSKAIPKGHEALGYSVVFSIGNLTSSASNILGSHLFSGGMKFTSLILVNAGSTALILLAIPFLPKRLMDGTEGEQLLPSEEPPILGGHL